MATQIAPCGIELPVVVSDLRSAGGEFDFRQA